MQFLDFGINVRNTACAVHNVLIQLGICEPKVVLVRLPAQSIGGCFLDQVHRQAEFMSELNHLMNHKLAQWAEIPCGITIFCRITHIILGIVAGIHYPSPTRKRLRNRIKRCHPDSGQQIDSGLIAHLHDSFELRSQSRYCFADIYKAIIDAKMLNQLVAVTNIGLFAIRHKDTHYPLLPKRFHTERGRNAAVFSSGDTDDGRAIPPILREILPNPLNHLFFCLFCIKSHILLLSFCNGCF